MNQWKRKMVAFLCVFAMAATLLPMSSVTVSAAKTGATATVSVTVSEAGEFARSQDNFKSIMAKTDLVVDDADEDGKLTVSDALIRMHNYYCKGGYAIRNGWITKFWGKDSPALGFYCNDQYVEEVADQKEIKTGDYISVFEYKDELSYSDIYSYFDKKNVETTVNSAVALQLQDLVVSYGENGKAISKTNPIKDAVLYHVAFDGTKTKLNVKTDENGKVNISFDKPGTYVITAGDVTVLTKDWMGNDVAASLVAPVCVVTVKEQAPAAPAQVTPAQSATTETAVKKDTSKKTTTAKKTKKAVSSKNKTAKKTTKSAAAKKKTTKKSNKVTSSKKKVTKKTKKAVSSKKKTTKKTKKATSSKKKTTKKSTKTQK